MIVQIVNGSTVTNLCDGSDRTTGKMKGPETPFMPPWVQATQMLVGLRTPAQSVANRQNFFYQGDLIVNATYADIATAFAAAWDWPATVTDQAAAAGAYLKVSEGSTIRATQDHHTAPTAATLISWAIQKIQPRQESVAVKFTFTIILGGPLVAFS